VTNLPSPALPHLILTPTFVGLALEVA